MPQRQSTCVSMCPWGGDKDAPPEIPLATGLSQTSFQVTCSPRPHHHLLVAVRTSMAKARRMQPPSTAKGTFVLPNALRRQRTSTTHARFESTSDVFPRYEALGTPKQAWAM